MEEDAGAALMVPGGAWPHAEGSCSRMRALCCWWWQQHGQHQAQAAQ